MRTFLPFAAPHDFPEAGCITGQKGRRAAIHCKCEPEEGNLGSGLSTDRQITVFLCATEVSCEPKAEV